MEPRSPALQEDSLPAEPPGKPKNTGVGSLPLLQRIFPARGWNPGLPPCRRILYQLSHQGSPRILEWVAYPFSSGAFQPRDGTQVSCLAGAGGMISALTLWPAGADDCLTPGPLLQPAQAVWARTAHPGDTTWVPTMVARGNCISGSSEWGTFVGVLLGRPPPSGHYVDSRLKHPVC